MQIVLNHKIFHVLFLLYFSLLSFLGRVAWSGLRSDQDAVFAQKAKEIISGGNAWVTTYHGVANFEHSPLPIWMQAVAFKLFKVSVYSAVLPSALFATGIILLLYHLGARLSEDRWTAFLAGMILLVPGYFLECARRGQGDIHLAFFVILALFAFWRASENPLWHYLFGLAVAFAILSNVQLGVIPIVIVLLHEGFSPESLRRANIHLVMGILLGLGLGYSWFVIHWLGSGETLWTFLLETLSLGERSLQQGVTIDPLFHLKQLVVQYWPWLPFLMVSLVVFVNQWIGERKEEFSYILIWFLAGWGILSLTVPKSPGSVLLIYPAMAFMVAHLIGLWLKDRGRFNLSLGFTGVLMVSVFVIGASNIEVQAIASLRQNSPALRDLAPAVNLNTPPGASVGNFKIHGAPSFTASDAQVRPSGSTERFNESRSGLYFFGDRYLEDAIDDPEVLMLKVKHHPEKTWLTKIQMYKNLSTRYPGRLFLIHGNSQYAYFTSMENRDKVSRDFSRPGLTFIQ